MEISLPMVILYSEDDFLLTFLLSTAEQHTKMGNPNFNITLTWIKFKYMNTKLNNR